ncbi:uncharacterized protein LOC114351056, partial [Ostrinia furnacalis]|uniref:uncharacterized protein LOC114351056 n=1 Tax=Ostrinia furnacalis TaxID=93504 RepID=UPI00103E2B28
FPSIEEHPDSPDIVMGQLWLQDDTTQVEIIELDSDDAEVTTTGKEDYNFGQYWQYVDKDRYSMPQPEIYRTNKKAREKRRMMQNNNFTHENSPEILENEIAEVVNDIVYSSFYGSTNDVSDTKPKNNHPSNCFTIINKPFNSDTSSDEIEFIDRADNSDHMNGDMPYDSEIITFDQDADSNKRTIWIYSFRNKRILSDNDYELVNIPSQDSTSSTSCSLENFCEEPNVTKNTRRVASPIPATYVPRLNLSMATTLPTVTEITEPTRNNVPDESPKSINGPISKPINNWFDTNTTTNGFLNHVDKQDKSSNTNVVNWMSLSPRERRRRSRHTKFSPTCPSKLEALVEVPSAEPKSNDSLSENSHKIQIKAEINVVDEKVKNVATVSSNRNLPPSIKTDIIIVKDMDDEGHEGGDFDKQLLQKPQIGIDVGRPKHSIITDPIEKLDSNNWIHEEKQNQSFTSESEVQELENTFIEHEDSKESASNKLWARNMSLLKPVAWAEFLPITESVPSLHLTIDSESEKQTWLKRLGKCFRCFK